MAVFIRTSPHAEGEAFHGNQANGKLLTPSNDTRDIIRVAMNALDQIWLDGHRYMKAGVMLNDFSAVECLSSTCLMSTGHSLTAKL
ncbi:hypothetical protein CG435_23405 [Pantoea ananatis]|uniref:DinB/UmuC family translesion DNA polymerase n=1 Tax=Pantoea ananas TaxID=553 RepID=UPI000CF4D9F5|nr:hypothetical protein CG435_23405 [Pantoea ananatis]